MRRLTRRGVLDRLAGRGSGRLQDDRGAVAVIVAVLLAGGVLLGFLALVIDVGELYLERSQLQSGADAAALAVASACAQNTSDCATAGDMRALAQTYADKNSADGISNVQQLCGNVPGNKVPACAAPIHNLTDCLGTAPTDGSPYIEVHLSTETLDGKFVLPPVFAQTLAGNQGYTGASVGACARAGWNTNVTVVLMTMSTCDFAKQTDGGTHFGMLTDDHSQRYVQFLDGGYDSPNCPLDPPPPLSHDVEEQIPPPPQPGQGMAALLDGLNCLGTMPADGNVTGRYVVPIQFQPMPQPCEDALRKALAGDGTMYIPIHDSNHVRANGTVDFHITGVAPFTVTGFEFGPPPPFEPTGHNVASTLTGHVCEVYYMRCIAGVFTGPIVPLSNLINSNNTIVKLTG
jgi:hypothetical protein